MKQILTIILLLLALTVEAQKGDKKHERNGRFLTTEIAIPDSIKNYASRIVDNGQDLDSRKGQALGIHRHLLFEVIVGTRIYPQRG